MRNILSYWNHHSPLCRVQRRFCSISTRSCLRSLVLHTSLLERTDRRRMSNVLRFFFHQFIDEAQLFFIQWIAEPFIDDQKIIVGQFFKIFFLCCGVSVQEHVLYSVEEGSLALHAGRFSQRTREIWLSSSCSSKYRNVGSMSREVACCQIEYQLLRKMSFWKVVYSKWCWCETGIFI